MRVGFAPAHAPGFEPVEGESRTNRAVAQVAQLFLRSLGIDSDVSESGKPHEEALFLADYDIPISLHHGHGAESFKVRVHTRTRKSKLLASAICFRMKKAFRSSAEVERFSDKATPLFKKAPHALVVYSGLIENDADVMAEAWAMALAIQWVRRRRARRHQPSASENTNFLTASPPSLNSA